MTVPAPSVTLSIMISPAVAFKIPVVTSVRLSEPPFIEIAPSQVSLLSMETEPFSVILSFVFSVKFVETASAIELPSPMVKLPDVNSRLPLTASIFPFWFTPLSVKSPPLRETSPFQVSVLSKTVLPPIFTVSVESSSMIVVTDSAIVCPVLILKSVPTRVKLPSAALKFPFWVTLLRTSDPSVRVTLPFQVSALSKNALPPFTVRLESVSILIATSLSRVSFSLIIMSELVSSKFPLSALKEPI